MYHVPLALQCIYMDTVMTEVKMGVGGGERNFRMKEESGDCRVSSMQMTWFCVVSRMKTWGQKCDVLLRCLGEEV